MACGVLASHFGNLQEGLFVGAALAGTRLAARLPSIQRLILSASIWGLLLAVLPTITFVGDSVSIAPDPAVATSTELPSFEERRANLLYGLIGGMANFAAGAGLGLALAVGIYSLWSANKRRVWPVRAFRAAIVAGAIASVANIAIVSYMASEPRSANSSSWARGFGTTLHYVGFAGAWLIATPIGLSIGTLLGRTIPQGIGEGRTRKTTTGFPARLMAAGGALIALIVVPYAIPPGPPIRLDETACFGPGPLLAWCERVAVGALDIPPTVIRPAIFLGKLLVLSLAMLLAGSVEALCSRKLR